MDYIFSTNSLPLVNLKRFDRKFLKVNKLYLPDTNNWIEDLVTFG